MLIFDRKLVEFKISKIYNILINYRIIQKYVTILIKVFIIIK